MTLSYKSLSGSTSSTASSITCTSANTMYESLIDLQPAIYTITCTSSTIATIEIYSSVSTFITRSVTVSGSVTINLSTAGDRVRVWTNTGSNIVVTFTKVASALTDRWSGTLDTVTTTSTYTGTSSSGYGYAILVAGGGGGGGGATGRGSSQTGGGGGGSGTAEKLVQLTGSMSVVIGNGGAAGGNDADGGAAGTSTFAGMSVSGGLGGIGGMAQPGGLGSQTVTGGSINTLGVNGAYGQGVGGVGGVGGAPNPTYTFVRTSAQIGTGGTGGGYTVGGAAGTGYGTGGGGGGTTGGAGAPGVLYILRF